MKNIRRLVFVSPAFCVAFGIAFGLALGTAFAQDEITICPGESTYSRIFKRVIPPFEKKTGIKVTIPIDPKKYGAFDTLKMVIEGKCGATANAVDFESWMGMMAEKGAKTEPSTLTYRVIGRDYVSFFVNPNLGVNKLTLSQVSSILLGKTKNWKEVGGPDLPVKVIASKIKAGTISMLRKRLLSDKDFVQDARWEATYEDVIKAVAGTPGSIGFISGKNKAPEVLNLETEEVGRPITMITLGKPSEPMQKLIQFMAGEGKSLQEK